MPWTTGAASLYVEKKKAQSSPALQRSPKHRSSSSSSLSLVFDLSVKKRTFRFFLRIEASQPTSLFLSTNRLSSSPSATAAASSSSAARRPVHRYFQGSKGVDLLVCNMYFEGYGYRGSTFEQTYRCYPASFIDKPQLETGDKIIMPPSALDRLASLHIEYPMLFEVRNTAAERASHCGVLEFIAEEGMIYMPYWMMQNLLLQEGDMVFIKNANLPKGTYVKLQPHTTDFLDISNPKAILEKTLRNYSCLTTGDSIMVAYNNKKYYIDIVETKPSSAISIIETDCEVDFAPPLDYKEPERPKPTAPPTAAPTAEAEAEEEPMFTPFTGPGRRLDGKPSKDLDASGSSPAKRQANATNSVQPSTASTSQSTAPRKTTGKLVFGSGGNQSSKETDKVPEKDAEEDPKKEEPKLSAFTGKKYSLKG